MNWQGTTAQPIAVLRTKCHTPQVRTDWVRRPRLEERLDQGLDRKLVLISAPAKEPGYFPSLRLFSAIQASGSADPSPGCGKAPIPFLAGKCEGVAQCNRKSRRAFRWG